MELVILFILALVTSGALVIYRHDKAGWNATFKRLSTMTRANLEAGKPVKALEPVKDMDEWDAAFRGTKESHEGVKHVIVKKDYYISNLNGDPWPRWRCKCGQTGKYAIGSMSQMEWGQQQAKRQADEHVRDANLKDQIIENGKGKTHQW